MTLERIVLGVLFMVGIAIGAVSFADSSGAPSAIVRSFNESLTRRDLEKALAFVAPGSVQLNLRPSHAGLGTAPDALTSDLRAHWSMIGPVLFSATQSYSRKVEVVNERTDGDLATVWTMTTTVSARPDAPQPRKDQFSEMYVLVRQAGEWKIGAIADNRKPNDVGLGGPR